jgi:hypothetical protein
MVHPALAAMMDWWTTGAEQMWARAGRGDSSRDRGSAGRSPSQGSPRHGDLFYAGGSAETWDLRLPAERASRVIDWQRKHQLLSDLRDTGSGSWMPFDWAADGWDADDVPFAGDPISIVASPVVILEGAYGARPELHDVLDLLVLLDVPRDVRRRQLLDRVGVGYRADWEARWAAAEDYYFASVMPSEQFDLVLGSIGSAET